MVLFLEKKEVFSKFEKLKTFNYVKKYFKLRNNFKQKRTKNY